MLDALADPIFVKDLELRFSGCNAALCDLLGRLPADIVGRMDEDLFPADQVAVFRRIDLQILATGEPFRVEEWLSTPGGLRRIMTRKFPLRDPAGLVIGLCGTISDITDLHERQTTLDRVVEVQRERLTQLAVPVLQIWSSTLLLPLIGELDQQRAAQVRHDLLAAVSRSHARVVLIDVTGLRELTAATAHHLVQATRACTLLGARSILVGVRPELAALWVASDVDLRGIPVQGTLEAGLKAALAWLANDRHDRVSADVGP